MMKISLCFAVIPTVFLFSACNAPKVEHKEETHQIFATTPEVKDVTITDQFVCQIHSRRHIQVRALERGYLEAIPVKEGQAVKAGDPMFNVIPILYKSKLEAEAAGAKAAQLQYDFSKKLFDQKIISENEVALFKTKVMKAQADVKKAEAELNFASVKAAFDGIVDRLHCQQGSLVEEGEILTTLSDNSVMWVYFNVPEARYFEYSHHLEGNTQDLKIELMLADSHKFDQLGTFAAIEADFSNTSGNIPFRADFPNPDHLLRNGQTGTILISRIRKDAIVIPQRATFDMGDKRCVFVIDENNVAHQRVIVIGNELEDIYVIKEGLNADEKFVFEGIREVHDGEKVEYLDRRPEDIEKKYHAE